MNNHEMSAQNVTKCLLFLFQEPNWAAELAHSFNLSLVDSKTPFK